jgi:mono/diheme cytochrome c family protein
MKKTGYVHFLWAAGTVTASIVLVIVLAGLAAPQAYAQASGAEVTFSKHVAPILQQNCQVCHRPNTVAPMSFLTYQDVRPWARSIRQAVSERVMPPWYVDRNVGVQHYANDVSLSDEEIATIVRWVDSGAPQGNPADMPPNPSFDDGSTWEIGQPDLIVKLPETLTVKATGADQWLNILVDPNLTEDRYIKGVQTMVLDGKEIFHHIITSMRPAEDAEDAGQGNFLNEYAVGKHGDVFPEGSGRLIQAGTRINFNIHLSSAQVSEETTGDVVLGLKFYPEGYTPEREVVTLRVGNLNEVDIRPNSVTRTDAYQLLEQPAKVLSFQPHMHNRGKYACLEAILPGGATEMLSCANFSFAWHLNYIFDPEWAPLLPAGTMLHAINIHDNTAANPANPDPDAMLTWGQRGIDEMTNPWISYYYMSEEEFQAELAERESRQEQVLVGSR